MSTWSLDPTHLAAAPDVVERIERCALALTFIRAQSLVGRWCAAVDDARPSDKRGLGEAMARPVLFDLDASRGTTHIPGTVGASSSAFLQLATPDGPVPVALVLSSSFEATGSSVSLRQDDTTMQVGGTTGRLQPVACVGGAPALIITQHLRFEFTELTTGLKLTSAKLLALPSALLTAAYTDDEHPEPEFWMAGKGADRIRVNPERLRQAASWRVLTISLQGGRQS